MPVPKNKALYSSVVAEAKQRFKVWPSIAEYKKRGGTYSGEQTKEGITRWYVNFQIECHVEDRVKMKGNIHIVDRRGAFLRIPHKLLVN